MPLMEFLEYGFVQRALITGMLIAAVCSLVGVFLVLRRFSMIGDGLAHVTFGSVALVLLLGVSPLYVTLAALPLVILSSLTIYRLTATRRIHGDAAIGIVSSVGIAAGIMLASLSGGFTVDLFSYLFGNILTATQMEMALAALVFVACLAMLFFFYPQLFAITFDEELARSMGIKTQRINLMLFVLTAVASVLAMRVAGIMMVTAMLIIPPIAALQLSLGFRLTLLFAALISVVCVVFGMTAAFAFNLPAGASIVSFNILFLALCFGGRKLIPNARR